MFPKASYIVSRAMEILQMTWRYLILLTKRNSYKNNLKPSNEKTVASKIRRRTGDSLTNIPAAKGWPLFGTIFDLIAAGGAAKLHQYIDKRHKKLGPIFSEQLGGPQNSAVVFVASASLMRNVFLHEGQHPKHPLPNAWILYNKKHNCQRGLFFMEGEEWLHNRRLLNSLLLIGNLDWMNSYIENCTVKFINNWKTHINVNKKSIAFDESVCTDDFIETPYIIENLESQLYRWAIDVICKIMFGEASGECTDIKKAIDEFSNIVHKVFQTSSALMDFPPALAMKLKLRIWSDFEESVSDVLKKGYDIIDLFIKDKRHHETNAELGMKVTLFNELQRTGMPLEIIKRIFVDLVIAAGDTTAYSSEWALYLLTQDPRLQEKVLHNIKNDSFIRGFIRETLRLYPVAPFIGRYMDCDALIENYHLKKDLKTCPYLGLCHFDTLEPEDFGSEYTGNEEGSSPSIISQSIARKLSLSKSNAEIFAEGLSNQHLVERRTLVLLSLYTAGRDPKYFPNPLSVQPDRWISNPNTGELRGVLNPHASLPFALGNRSCIGRRIATKQMHVLITTVISNFKLSARNTNSIECMLRLVTVPSEPLLLAVENRY